TRFGRLLQSQRGPGAVSAMDSLATECFRGLRKLGMKDEIDLLLRQMAELILESQKLRSVQELLAMADSDGPHTRDGNWLAALRALLHVASNWNYCGRDKQAEPVLNAARALLFRNVLVPPWQREQVRLACAYVATLGQAGPETAKKRIEELFHRLDGIRDTYTT